MKFKRNIKKILTAVACVMIVAAIVSLCSVAYLRDTTDAQSHSIRFANVSVSQQTGMETKAPAESGMPDVDENGYYLSLSEVNQGQEVDYSPTVTNNSEKEIYAYLVVTKPKFDGKCVVDNFDVNSESIEATGDNVVDGNWIYLMTKSYTDYETDVYGYSEKLEKGQTTKPLCTKFNVIKPTTEYTDSVLVNDKYAKFTLQTSGLGVQSAETALSFRKGEENLYNWNNEGLDETNQELKRKEILYNVWTGVASEQQYYITDKIYQIA